MLRLFGSAPTIGEKYKLAGFRPTGFDYMRLTLACGVIFWHSLEATHGEPWSWAVMHTQWRDLVFFLVPSFFALSGFLIAGSLERSTVPVFIGLRALRIYPALAVETTLSALIIGPMLTAYSLREYFSNKETWLYLGNITGHIRYRLPGVFLDNPFPAIVNGQLWTIPWEFICYVVITILALVGIARSPRQFLVAGVIAPMLAVAVWITFNRNYSLDDDLGPSQVTIVLSFLVGIAIYQLRDRIPCHWTVLVPLAIIAYLIAINTRYAAFASLPVAYITVAIGMTNFSRNILLRGGDYSYGIYLYGAVITNSLVNYGVRTWYVNFILSMVVVTIIAAFSWHYIEKPTLSLRAYLTGRRDQAGYFTKLMRAADPRRVRPPSGNESVEPPSPRDGEAPPKGREIQYPQESTPRTG